MKRTPLTSQRRREFAGAVVYALLASLVIGMIYLVVQVFGIVSAIRADQQVNAATGKSSASTLRLIEDCLSPDGYCADARAEADGRQAVVLTRISVFAAACADQPERQSAEQIETCVKALLDESNTGLRE